MLYQFLPRLADDEYADLEASIAEHGVQVPILVDENKSIIDGHHRAEIAERLGIECPRRFALDKTDEEKRTLALSLNLHRRHLSRDQRRDLVERSLKADPHLSDRQHAERTGVSPTTVGSRRAELEDAGELSKLDSRTSADGRERPATYTKTPPAPEGEAGPGAPTSEPAVRDGSETSSDTGGAHAAPAIQPEGAGLPSSPPPSSAPDLSDFIASSPEVALTGWRRRFMDAIAKSGELMLFTPADVAEKADVELINELERLSLDLNNYVSRVRAKRPTRLTSIRGGAQ